MCKIQYRVVYCFTELFSVLIDWHAWLYCCVWCRYTSLVDPYISCIAVCLKDESLLIRKQTLIMLTRLLQVCLVLVQSVHCSVCSESDTSAKHTLHILLHCPGISPKSYISLQLTHSAPVTRYLVPNTVHYYASDESSHRVVSSASTSSISSIFITFSWSRQLTTHFQHHHSLLPSPLNSFILASKPFFSINPTLHRHWYPPDWFHGLLDCPSAFLAQQLYFCFIFFIF